MFDSDAAPQLSDGERLDAAFAANDADQATGGGLGPDPVPFGVSNYFDVMYQVALDLPRWHGDALCAEYMGGTVDWFADSTEAAAAPAIAICKRCSVKAECLNWALTKPEADGVWGATTPAERRALRASTRPPAAPDAPPVDVDLADALAVLYDAMRTPVADRTNVEPRSEIGRAS